jgi:glycosyltransferase involved in cell wall biosynthesis
MRIGLDARNVGRPGGTGIATYARALATAIDEQGGQVAWLKEDRDNRKRRAQHASSAQAARFMKALFSRSRIAVPADTQGNLLANDIFRIAHVHFNIHGTLLPVRTETPPALMHWTCPLPLRLEGCRNIVTVHDLIPVLRPELCDTDPRRMERLLRAVIDDTTLVVTISETVRRDILQTFSVPPDRVRTIHQGVGFPDGLLLASIEARAPCPEGSFVYVGSIEKRKNIGRLIEAHGRSRTMRMLVLIGPDGYAAREELAAINRHPHPERVLRLPWVERPQLIKALSTARALAFPSLAEGFGLPIVEAMLLGTPVLTAEGGATGEIAGNAACLVDAESTDAIADGLRRLSGDDSLCDRLVSAGFARAGAFEPGHYARRINDLYSQVLNSPPAP